MNPDEREFTIKVTMKDRWIPHFLAMLDYMRYIGGIGSSRLVSFYSDGDGDFHPKFEWDIDVILASAIKDDDGHRTYDAG